MASDVAVRRQRSSVVGLVLFALFLIGLVLHTAFDRLTPYTSEATLQAPVVGVAPNISGTIVSVKVQDNQPVHAGEHLFQIDPQRFQVAVEQAEANLNNATQSVGASTAALAGAAAKVSDAKASLANERAQTERILQLAARDFAPRAQADAAQAKLANAEGGVRAAEASLEEARKRLGPTNEGNPQIKAALAQYERARIDLNDTDVKAPIDGMVTNTVLAPGHFASAGHTVATVVDTEAGWVVANLPENTLGNIGIGDPVLITFNVAPGRILDGRVASIASGVARSPGGAAGEGDLPYVVQRRQWLREVQRIPVRIELLRQTDIPAFRVGSRANVVVMTKRAGLAAPFARAWLWLVSLADYVF
ncbi:MAG TPA: HlyD family secretion protein [Stellaceae bacterium]|jgi:multidrug resistance efflux pump|nr:HlyD family secretion protein [Stellaceae bacterium]